MPNLAEMLSNKKTVFLGSSPENDIVLTDPQVSPVHCQISKIKNGVYLVVDLESASGTFINNRKVTKEFAGDYDSITIGDSVFRLVEEVQTSHAPSMQPFAAVPQTPLSSLGIAEPAPGDTAEPVQEKTTTIRRITANDPPEKKSILVYFLSAPEDEATCEAVYKHLSTIRFSSPMPVEMIGDFKIGAGEELTKYKDKIAEASIVLAFVSVDFLNNNECYRQLQTVIDNHNKGKAILLPILVRNCMWKATPFAKLPLLPKNQQPLNNRQFWNSEDDALTNVADDIYHSISQVTKNSTPEAPLSVGNSPTLQTNWRGNYLWKHFWKRTAAYILDVIILIFPVLLTLYLVFGDGFMSDAGDIPLFYNLLYTGALILVFSYFDCSKWRGSPGKHILKLQITDDVGNPISFSTAIKRNTIKFFLFGFIGTMQNTETLSFLLILAQIGCFVVTRKFIHDYLSRTLIGERLQGEEQVPLGSGEKKAGQTISAPTKKTGISMVAATIGIIALICIGLLVGFSLLANKEVQLTEERKAGLVSAITYGNATEIEALGKLDPNVLTRAFTGEQLRQAVTTIQQLTEARKMVVSELENQAFLDFKLSDDGAKAEVNVNETWNSIYYSADTGECEGRIPSHSAPQTVYLELVNGVWMIYNIVHHSTDPVQQLPCN